MSLPDAVKGIVEYGCYPAGHMVYLYLDALKQMKIDLAKWYDEGK